MLGLVPCTTHASAGKGGPRAGGVGGTKPAVCPDAWAHATGVIMIPRLLPSLGPCMMGLKFGMPSDIESA